jgi:uncharacterized cysteine cluster protein YcgN (CxxCxxCC family)
MPLNNFWETKTLNEMCADEWESLCDGCGLCCLVKIEDEDSGEVFNTAVSCFMLDIESCRCRDYVNRFSKAPMCTQLTPENLQEMDWLPQSCAYKRLSAGLSLLPWHPLLTKDKKTVHEAGISAKWFAQSEEYVHPDQLVDMIIDLPEEVPDEE